MLSAKWSNPDQRRPHIALVDCNNFYASCERVFMPAWQHRPIGVLSNNDGCLVARSNEVKAAGIPMGAPYFKYKAQLEAINAIVVSSNYALYGDMSARVMNTLSQFAPEVEIYSIDEAWLDLSGFSADRLDGYGREIAATILQHTGIPVSIGIAPTKVLAKIANRICKKRNIPGRVFNLGNERYLDHVLQAVAVGDIWGVGPRWARRLKAQGIRTALDLRNADVQQIRDRYNVVMQRLVLELRGQPCLEFEEIQPKKQILASRSFGERVEDLPTLMEAVSSHAARAAEKLRSQSSVCGALQCSIRTGRHNPNEPFFGRSAVVQFPRPTADTRQLITAACQGLKQIYRQGPRYAKAGIMLLDLSSSHHQQGDLFSSSDKNSDSLMETIDKLNQLYGRRSVFFAGEGVTRSWSMKQERRTRSYTTQWEELPIVH